MSFKEKLDSLMEVFGVSNNRLAKALAVDASLVSRWRTGKRMPNPDSPHIKSIASYFAEMAKMDYQKTALWEIMGLPLSNYTAKKILEEFLQQWLKGQLARENVLINNFLDKIGKTEGFPCLPPSLPPEKNLTASHPLRAEILYGLEGKQKGVLAFLEAVLQGKELCPLLLYSDESMEWFRDDRLFMRRFASMFYQVIAKGHQVKIVHTISRDMSEMFAAIDFWLPFYITGAIQPYYCPKYREHYFRRTIFAAPGTAVLTSSTLQGLERNAPNLFSTDLPFVNSLTQEYYEYLNICRPLMHIFTDSYKPTLAENLGKFALQAGDCSRLSNFISPYTMPEEVFIRLLERSNIDPLNQKIVLEQYKLRKTELLNNLCSLKYTEIITLPSPAEIKQGAVMAEIQELAGAPPLAYTTVELIQHLKNIIVLLKEYKNYHLIISPRSFQSQITLTVKDETGVVIIKRDPPLTFFTFDHPNMTNAFFCYVEDYVNKIPNKNREKEEVIRMLEDLLQELNI